MDEIDPAALLLARLYRADYELFLATHRRYPEQEHSCPLLGLAEESRRCALRVLAHAGVAPDQLADAFDRLGEEN